MDAELSPLGGYGRDLTAAQRRIVREMERLIAEGPAAFFRDACLLMAGEPSLSSTTHLVAHLLREMESGIRRALEPPKVVKGRDGGHRASVLAVLESLGIAAGHKAAVTWLALADQDGSEGLARRAHRAGLDAPRPVDASFSTYFAGLEELFDYVLDQCDKHYHTIFDHLDALAAIEAPTSADVEAFRRRPQTFTAVRHFLGAAGPQWVKPLTESDYFTSPPDPKPDADGRVELPPWLPSDYLARMAEAEPAYVVGAALSIPATDNSRVNHDVVRVALAVPADHALELAPQIIRSLSCKYGVLIPDQVGAVAAHLAGGGFAEPALALMAEVLRILPGQSDSVVGAWELAQVMGRDMPALVAVSGVKALAMVCARLDRFISEDLSWSKEESGSDLSSTWWPDLRSSPANRETEPAAVLAEGVLAAGVQTIRGDQGQVAAVFAELRAHRWIIYRRIRLHLLACFPGEASDILREHLLDPSNLADANVQREYLYLAQARCAELSDSDREHLVGLIEAGPDRGAWTAAYAKFYDHEPSAADVNRFADVWTRDRLLACEAILTPSARARCVALVAEYPPSTEPVAQTRSPFIEVPPPRTAAELSALTAEELVDFLRDWEPDAKAFLGPDKGTLAAVLREVIAADRQRWSTHARDFARDVEAVYVSAVLESLAQGNNDPAQLDWVSVLDLCELVDERASHEAADALDGTGRPPWRDARLALLQLIEQGLNTRVIPESELARVWPLIVSGCADPDPQPDSEHGDEDPRLLAYNSVRPRAVRCAIAYALMRRDHETEMHTVLALLADHLEPVVDPSLTVRAVFGSNLPQLHAVAPAWVESHLARLLPPGERDRRFWDAAWDAFVERNIVSKPLFGLLRDTYALAVSRAAGADGDRRAQARAVNTGIHLLTYYWHGLIGLDTSDGLLRGLYGRVSAEACDHLTTFVSRSLREETAPDPDVLERLAAFWEFRVGAVHAGADPKELAEFGWWFASGFFEDGWAFGRLLHTLKTAGYIDAVDGVLERLAALSTAHTQLCLAALSAWAASNPPNLYMVASREDHIRAVLAAGFGGDEDDKAAASNVVGQLIGIGIDMRDCDPGRNAA